MPSSLGDKQRSMQEWQNVRRFGTRPEKKRCIVRPSAYAFILNRVGQLAIVKSSDGTFLPGGGIDEGETPEEAVIREALEECGFRIRVGACVNHAVQFVVSESQETYFEKRGYFFEAEIEEVTLVQVEPESETLWVMPETAGQFLSHASQTWAVQDWRNRNTNR